MAGNTNRLAEEQAALRRVATLVASSAQPNQVFQMVAEEAGRLLEARTAATVRFDQETAVVVGSWNDGEGLGIEVGTLVPYSDPESPVYRATHEGGRIDDYADVPGAAARLTRLAGYRSAGGGGNARERRRGPEARARGTPRTRTWTSSGRAHGPRPRTGPPVTRESRAVPGRNCRRSAAASRRGGRNSCLLPRRREFDQ